ncbi:MAG: ABC transporter substrate-binding protein [Clostridiales bacterium]|nr:ABC transporter substrate-binding protein [Clostridiales bacterium]
MKKFISKVLAFLSALTIAVPLTACSKDDGKVHIYMPDGAPAIALSALMDSGYAGADFTVVTASSIAGHVSSGNADMAIMPINAAAKLYNGGVDIVMLTVNTHGNLYIVGNSGVDELGDLVGMRLGVIGRGNVPDLILRMLLEESDIDYEVSDSAVSGKIALRYEETGGALLPLLGKGDIDYALLGEPAVTTATTKFEGKVPVIDMQETWELTIGGEYPQACLVAKGSLIDNRREFVNGFLAALEKSDGWAEANPDKALQAVKSHMQKGSTSELTVLSSTIVKRCNIYTVAAEEKRADCTDYFRLLTRLELDNGTTALNKVPDDNFYYQP